MSRALYRKYRPRKLTEVVGQEHITGVLARAIKAGKISHAYLLTGPRGVGKTSIARILAHEINGLEYLDDDTTHLDIIEIDAASNRRIDEIRDLREKVHIAPTSATYKVYIIDEVHMLTKEAFNALLKTLEEPPAHCIFILATTEIHKVPETIISRTQRFSFKPIEQATVVKHLRSLAKKEKIDITDDALELIASHGRGSFRDSIALLDQVGNGSSGTVTLEDVQETLGMARGDLLAQIQNATLHGSMPDVLATLEQITESGLSPTQLAKQLVDVLHAQLISNPSNPHQLLSLIEELMAISSSSNPALKLEMTLLKANLGDRTEASDVGFRISEKKQSKRPDIESQAQEKKPDKKSEARGQRSDSSDLVKETGPVEEIKTPETKPKEGRPEERGEAKPMDVDTWQKILNYIKEHSPSLTASLRMAAPRFYNDVLQLQFAQSFHQKRNSSPKIKDVVSKAVESVLGAVYQIETTVEKGITPLLGSVELTRDLSAVSMETIAQIKSQEGQITTPAAPSISDSAKSVMDLFGGGEVV